MAASDKFTIEIEGKGGHAAMPHNAVDPVTVAAHLITALQTIVSRNVDPARSAVVTVTMLRAGGVQHHPAHGDADGHGALA